MRSSHLTIGKGDSVDKLIRRTIVSFLLVTFVSLTIYIFPLWAYCLVIVLFTGFALFEFFAMLENRDIFVYKYFGIAMGCLVPVAIFAGHYNLWLRNLEPLLIVVASILTFVLQIIKKDETVDHLVSMSVTLFALFYISWFFSFLVKLRFLENGANLVFFIIVVVKSADIGAYLGGSKFGKHELIPRISPNKTTEGVISGVIVSILIAISFGRILTGFGFVHLAIIGFIVASIGQLGDLAESLIKRNCKVKDSGTSLSEIGGVFDVIDSLLFSVPIFFLYIRTL